MKRLMRLKKDNKGVALVSVLIVISLVMILAGSLLTLAGTAYRMRMVNTKAKNTFYNTESYLDETQVILQTAAGNVLNLENYSAANFITAVKAEIAGSADAFTATAVSDYIKTNMKAETYSNSRGYVKSITVGSVSETASTLEINDLKITYINTENHDGDYEETIKTDIVINTPEARTSVSTPSNVYSVLAGSGIDYTGNEASNSSNNHPSYLVQEGSAYVGCNDNGNSLKLDNSVHVNFTGTRIIFNGDVVVDNMSTLIFSGRNAQVTVKGTIYLDHMSTLVLGRGVQLTCNNIVAYCYTTNSEQGTGMTGTKYYQIDLTGEESGRNYTIYNCNDSDNEAYSEFFPYKYNPVSHSADAMYDQDAAHANYYISDTRGGNPADHERAGTSFCYILGSINGDDRSTEPTGNKVYQLKNPTIVDDTISFDVANLDSTLQSKITVNGANTTPKVTIYYPVVVGANSAMSGTYLYYYTWGARAYITRTTATWLTTYNSSNYPSYSSKFNLYNSVECDPEFANLVNVAHFESVCHNGNFTDDQNSVKYKMRNGTVLSDEHEADWSGGEITELSNKGRTIYYPTDDFTLSDLEECTDISTYHFVNTSSRFRPTTAEGEDLTVTYAFGSNMDMTNGAKVGLFLFVLADRYTVQFNSGDYFTGVLMCRDRVSYQIMSASAAKGVCIQYSVLDNEADYTEIKDFYDTVGECVIGKGRNGTISANQLGTQYQYHPGNDQNATLYYGMKDYIVNNFFNEGTKCFYSTDTTSEISEESRDANSAKNLIQLKNWTVEVD